MRWLIALVLATGLTIGLLRNTLLFTQATDGSGRRAASGGQKAEASDRTTWSLSRKDARALKVRAGRGDITVSTGGGDKIEVTTTRTARSSSQVESEDVLARLTVERRREGDAWVVETQWPKPFPQDVDSASIDFAIRLPAGMDLEAETSAGNVEVRGIRRARLHTGAGDLRVSGIAVALDAGTGAGNIEAEGCDGAVKVRSGSGNVRVAQAGSGVQASAGEGNVEVGLAPANRAAPVDLRIGVGDILLRLPKNSSARVEAHTGVGEVGTEPKGIGKLSRNNTRLEAVLGEGRGNVRLHAGVGDVRLQLGNGR